jgi:hypothetical protein
MSISFSIEAGGKINMNTKKSKTNSGDSHSYAHGGSFGGFHGGVGGRL